MGVGKITLPGEKGLELKIGAGQFFSERNLVLHFSRFQPQVVSRRQDMGGLSRVCPGLVPHLPYRTELTRTKFSSDKIFRWTKIS